MSEPMGNQTRGLAYSFPLRPDFLAQLVLPKDMTRLEVRRLQAFLNTLAITDESSWRVGRGTTGGTDDQ